MSRWSARWGWIRRVELYDAELYRRIRLTFVQAQIEARERHARVAQAALTTLTIPVRALLDTLRDPTVLERLTRQACASPAGLIALLGVATRCASAIPAIIAVERLSLGMTTDSLDVDDKPDLSFANRIAADPEAVELAIGLLARVSLEPSQASREI